MEDDGRGSKHQVWTNLGNKTLDEVCRIYGDDTPRVVAEYLERANLPVSNANRQNIHFSSGSAGKKK